MVTLALSSALVGSRSITTSIDRAGLCDHFLVAARCQGLMGFARVGLWFPSWIPDLFPEGCPDRLPGIYPNRYMKLPEGCPDRLPGKDPNRYMEQFSDWFPDWFPERFLGWITESLLVLSLVALSSIARSFIRSVHCARGSAEMVAWSGASVGSQARQSVSKSIDWTVLCGDGLRPAVGRQVLTVCARVWLRFRGRHEDFFRSCAPIVSGLKFGMVCGTVPGAVDGFLSVTVSGMVCRKSLGSEPSVF